MLNKLKEIFYKKFIGESFEVLWENKIEPLRGKAKNYLEVVSQESNIGVPGEISKVKFLSYDQKLKALIV